MGRWRSALQHGSDYRLVQFVSGSLPGFRSCRFDFHQTFKRLRTAASNPLPLKVQMEELGGFGYRQLVLIRLLTLFVEIMMIRRVSSEVRIFAYFKNFVLLACFLGFGLGCYLCRRRV